MVEGVSIVITTYNGVSRLKPTLDHLASQNEIDFDIELVVVDNCSTDNTSNLVKKYWNELGSPYNLRVLYENKPGTMYAREKGINEAIYRYILYCDDDNWFCENYVMEAFNIISGNEAIAAVGGAGELVFENGFTPPNWIAKYEHSYGASPQGKKDGDITNVKGCLYTAGTIIDRVWLNKLYKMGFKSSLQGRIGKSLLGGEDTELTYALKLIGGKLFYSSKMSFMHFMPSNRITWKYLKKLWQSFGYSDFIISPYNYHFSNKSYLSRNKMIYLKLKQLVRGYLIQIIKSKSEGDKIVLENQRNNGALKAMMYDYKKFIYNKKMIKKLSV